MLLFATILLNTAGMLVLVLTLVLKDSHGLLFKSLFLVVLV